MAISTNSKGKHSTPSGGEPAKKVTQLAWRIAFLDVLGQLKALFGDANACEDDDEEEHSVVARGTRMDEEA
jgi:hypothetical protein